MLLAIAGCNRSDVNPIPFEASAWKGAKAIDQHRTVRSQMVGDLLKHHKFTGWSRQQVVELLGEPTPGEPAKMGFSQCDIVYVLGLERAGALSLDDEALGFKFDEHGRVSKYGVTPN